MNLASIAAAVAARPRLRALLRLPRARETNQWYPDLVYDNHPVDQPATPEEGYHFSDRHHRQGDRVHPRRQGDRAGQAVLPLLLPRRRSRAAPRAEGVGGQVQGQVRHGLRGLPRAGLRSGRRSSGILPESAELSPINPYIDRTGPSGKAWPALDTVRPWDSLTDDEKRLFCPHGRGLRRLPQPRRPPDRPDARLPRGERASSTTRSIVLVSDNGASGEGGPNGSVNENKFFNGLAGHDRGEPASTSTCWAAR